MRRLRRGAPGVTVALVSMLVVASLPPPAHAVCGGWMHPGGQIFADVVRAAGFGSLSFAVPSGAALGNSHLEIVEEADLVVTLADAVDPIIAGDVQIYELSVINKGPANATGVTLQLELPPGSIFLGAEPSSVACELLSGVLVECELGTLAPRATVGLEVGVLVDHRIDGKIESEVLVSGNEPDPDNTNDEAEADTEALRAREMVWTSRGGAAALGAILKEGDSTVALIFTDPTGGDREYSVEAAGYRATSLTEVPSFGGTPSPELAVLAAGFSGETKVIVVDADDQTLLGDHDIVGSWFATDIVALPSFAGTAAPELAIALGSSSELRVQVLDAASGTVVRDHLIAASTPNPPGPDIVAPFPIGMVTVPSFDGTPQPELAILAKNPDTEEVRVWLADADSGVVLRDHGQGGDLFPLGIVGLPDLGLSGGTTAADIAILLRRASTEDLHVKVLDASNGAPSGPIDFDDTLKPGVLVTVPNFAGGPAPELALLGRRDPADLRVDIKDAATGALVSSIAAGSPPLVPAPLGLATVPSFAGGPSPEIGVLFEFLGADAQISVFDGLGAAPLFNFFLP